MNRRKIFFLLRLIVVFFVTIAVSISMLAFRDVVHRSESMRAMTQLSAKVLAYREKNGISPPDYLIDQFLENVQGAERLGKLQYRSRWINIDSKPDEILAYSFKQFNSPFLDDGYAVMLLDGTVMWMDKGDFETLLNSQQGELEKHLSEIQKL